jgi:triosephosphate isomerase
MCPKHLSRRKIVAGNWKMNGEKRFAEAYLSGFEECLKAEGFQAGPDLSILLFPPAILLSVMNDRLKKQNSFAVELGGQNVAAYVSGAYTGEISAGMLKEFSSWSLVGHSERRALFGDTDQLVVEKISRLHEAGLAPILCLGETLEQRENGQAERCVRLQLEAVLSAFESEQLTTLVLAYEPVWAIGTGKTASPEQAQSMHAFIRSVLHEKSQMLAETMPILYGGSVTSQNAGDLFRQHDIDGALVGGASLKMQEFASICSQCAALA